jgi:hypothetical protein
MSISSEHQNRVIYLPYNQRTTIWSFSVKKIEKIIIYTCDIMWNKIWDEWFKSLSSRIITKDDRFQSQTKSLIFNTKIYCHDNAQDKDMLMKQ